MQVKCGSEARRSAVRDSADWNGIDYLGVRTIPENGVYKNFSSYCIASSLYLQLIQILLCLHLVNVMCLFLAASGKRTL